MHDVVSDSCHFAAHFFSGSQMQLDSFAGAALKEAEDGGVWFRGGFFVAASSICVWATVGPLLFA